MWNVQGKPEGEYGELSTVWDLALSFSSCIRANDEGNENQKRMEREQIKSKMNTHKRFLCKLEGCLRFLKKWKKTVQISQQLCTWKRKAKQTGSANSVEIFRLRHTKWKEKSRLSILVSSDIELNANFMWFAAVVKKSFQVAVEDSNNVEGHHGRKWRWTFGAQQKPTREKKGKKTSKNQITIIKKQLSSRKKSQFFIQHY